MGTRLGMGIGLGVMLTPKSGPATRKLLKTKAAEGVDYVGRRGSEMADRAGEIVERAKRVANRHAEKLADAAEAGTRTFQNI